MPCRAPCADVGQFDYASSCPIRLERRRDPPGRITAGRLATRSRSSAAPRRVQRQVHARRKPSVASSAALRSLDPVDRNRHRRPLKACLPADLSQILVRLDERRCALKTTSRTPACRPPAAPGGTGVRTYAKSSSSLSKLVGSFTSEISHLAGDAVRADQHRSPCGGRFRCRGSAKQRNRSSSRLQVPHQWLRSSEPWVSSTCSSSIGIDASESGAQSAHSRRRSRPRTLTVQRSREVALASSRFSGAAA